jgi:RNA polymerase subunit RPABC4/transcription elongation factor Spt4
MKRRENNMAKCNNCGEPLHVDAETCPKCGLAGGPETITDLPRADVKGARARLKEDIKDAREREEMVEAAECRSCGEPLPGKDNTCPKCGLAGGPETMTDMPPLHLREAHRQLKKEIKEAKEKRKE